MNHDIIETLLYSELNCFLKSSWKTRERSTWTHIWPDSIVLPNDLFSFQYKKYNMTQQTNSECISKTMEINMSEIHFCLCSLLRYAQELKQEINSMSIRIYYKWVKWKSISQCLSISVFLYLPLSLSLSLSLSPPPHTRMSAHMFK